MTNTTPTSRTRELVSLDFTNNNTSKCATLGFAIALIVGIGCLIAAGIGCGGLLHVGALNTLGQVNSMFMIVIGGAGSIPCLAIGIVGFRNLCSRTTTEEAVSQKQLNPRRKEDGKILKEEGSALQIGTTEGEQKAPASSDVQTQDNDIHAQTAPVYGLPQDMLALIFHFLTLKELATVALVCKHWKFISDSNAVWQRLFIPKFGLVDDTSETFSYKSEYKKYKNGFFENPTDILLREHHEHKVVGVVFGTDSVVSWDKNKRIKIWYPDKELCMTMNLPPPIGSSFLEVNVASDNRTVALRDSSTVQAFKIQAPFHRVDDRPFFQYEHSYILPGTTTHHSPHFVVVHGDIVASAAANNVQVWDCKTQKRLHDLSVDGFVHEVVIKEGTVVCRHGNGEKRRVEIFSLKTGESLHQFSADDYISIYKDTIVCVDGKEFHPHPSTISVYSLKSKECLCSFSPAPIWVGRPTFKKVIVHNNLLIFLSHSGLSSRRSPDQYAARDCVDIYSAANGAHLKSFPLGSDWGWEDMAIQGNDLIVSGRTFRQAEARSVKLWKFSPQI